MPFPFSKWPLLRQIRERKDGTGVESMSDKTRAMHARIDGARVTGSICPYCGVGCGQLIYHDGKKIISIEGDPESPISQGNLCPKGAASYQLLTHSRRETKVKYRALHVAHSGWLIRGGEILSGPLALLLRGFALIPFAGISFLLGALISRFGWIEAGRVSGNDPEAVFASQR